MTPSVLKEIKMNWNELLGNKYKIDIFLDSYEPSQKKLLFHRSINKKVLKTLEISINTDI